MTAGMNLIKEWVFTWLIFNSQVKGLCSMIKKRKVATLKNRDDKFPSSAAKYFNSCIIQGPSRHFKMRQSNKWWLEWYQATDGIKKTPQSSSYPMWWHLMSLPLHIWSHVSVPGVEHLCCSCPSPNLTWLSNDPEQKPLRTGLAQCSCRWM